MLQQPHHRLRRGKVRRVASCCHGHAYAGRPGQQPVLQHWQEQAGYTTHPSHTPNTSGCQLTQSRVGIFAFSRNLLICATNCRTRS